MKTPCEIIVAKILPNIRALVAIELKESYKLKGKEIAKLTGTTEAAISQYLHGVRGIHTSFVQDFPEVPPFVRDVSQELYEKRDTEIELTEKVGTICIALRNNRHFIEMFSKGKEPVSCGICFREDG